jgi:hypothetical protein
MADLPRQDNLTVPIQWSGETQKTSIQAAGYMPTVTLGWRPWTERATLEWRLLSASEANAMLDQFRLTNFNGVFDYQCALRGKIRLRLSGEYGFTEEYATKTVAVTVGVTRV